ncbi:MAG: DNA-directed RNA polymerase subunit H [Desulfurococcales archaeon ex4484_58]|nr:MAG: DNA-directed RNA polymerase subunit H [Desulfurococcales archaeon ex4484_58]
MPSKKTKINILEHELVPKHEVLSPEEASKVLKRLNIKPTQLPWISIDDPIVRLIKAKPGDIIKITRKSPTAGESIAYRYVVVDTLHPKKKGGK